MVGELSRSKSDPISLTINISSSSIVGNQNKKCLFCIYVDYGSSIARANDIFFGHEKKLFPREETQKPMKPF
jgi:hypothetical protein